MQFNTKFGFEKVFFINRFGIENKFDSEWTTIKFGEIDKIIFSNNEKCVYNISNGDMYHRNISENLIFRSEKECEEYLVRKIIEERHQRR